MHWHQLRSHVPQVFQVTSHIVGFRSVLQIVNSIFVAVTIYSILICTRIPCRDSHCENGSFEVLSLHTPSVAADPIATKKKTIKKIVKLARLRCYPKTITTVSPFYHVALHASSFIDFL